MSRLIPATLADLLREQALAGPERVALLFAGVETSYGELDRRASRVANALLAEGLVSGDRVHVKTPGGGGYGNPCDRSPEAVLEDVALERYSVDQALALFGVVLSGDPLEVDQQATRVARETMQGG